MDENDSRNANKPAAPLVPPPSMGSPEQIAEAKEFAKKRAAEQKPAPPPEKKSGTATVYYSAAGDVAGVSFDGKHYKNDSDRDDRIDLQQTAGLATATLSKKTFQIENIDPKKLRHELESRAQETVNNAIKEQLAPQQPSVTTPQSNTAPTPPPVSPAKRNRGLPGKLSAKPTYDPNALQKPQQPAAPQTVVQQKVAVQLKPEEPQPAESKQSSSAAAHAEPSTPDNDCYNRLEKKCADINKSFAASESTKDSTLAKEGDVYHIKTPSKDSDIVVNRDGSMQGGSHPLDNKDDPKAIADKISAEMVVMAKAHQASGSKEPFHLEVKMNEPLSDEQRIKAKQIEKLVQHNLEKEFDTGNKNDLNKSQFTFAGKPIPPLAPAPPAQKIATTPQGSTAAKAVTQQKKPPPNLAIKKPG